MVCVSGLLLLSWASHQVLLWAPLAVRLWFRARHRCTRAQEPRFLVPIAAPLCICLGGSLVAGSRRMRFGWFFFNTLLALFYGWVHQVCASSCE